MGSCPDTDIDLYEETRSITTPPWMGCFEKANCFAPGTQQNDLVSARPGVQCTNYKAPASPSKQKPIKVEVFIYFNIINVSCHPFYP